jgi:chromosome segregation ATPase
VRLSDSSDSSRQRSNEEDDDEAAAEDDTEETPPPPPTKQFEEFQATQHDLARDAHLPDRGEEKRDDREALERLQKRTAALPANSVNTAAENAILEEVTAINFMCHTKMTVTLGPNINFIIGVNGSGKSAILTAIVLCLGGKASATNRGGSLKAFIKNGCDSSTLIVKLKNQGADAYKPDIYGRTIIVERHFSQTGSSSFKLKSAAGRIISSKKADVDDLVDYFQMQVDNPMNILTQDMARSFINSESPTEKYKLFLRGVQLEQLDNDYRLVGEMADTMWSKIQDVEEDTVAVKRRRDELKEKFEAIQRRRNMRTEEKRLLRQCAWAQVEEEEKGLAARQKVVDEYAGRVQEQQLVLEDADAKLAEADNVLASTIALRDSVIEELGPLKDEEDAAKEEVARANEDLIRTHTEERQIKDHLQAAKDDVDKITKEIDAELKRIENANGGAHARKLEELAAADEEVKKAVEEIAQMPDDRQLQDRVTAAAKAHTDSQQPIEMKKKEIGDARVRLGNIQKEVGGRLAGFHPRMPQLLKAIDNERGWGDKPIGPIGLYITLKKPIWSDILESTIGNALNGFCVTNKRDQQRLMQMMREMRIYNSPIIIGNNHPMDTSRNEPDPDFDTVLRVLDIEHDIIRNALIIQQSIEQSILIETREDAMRVLYNGPRPQNVKQCFTFHEHNRGWGMRYAYMSAQDNGGNSAPIRPLEHAKYPRMKTDIESQIAVQRDTLRHLENDLKNLTAKSRELQAAVQRADTALKQHKRDKQAALTKRQRAEDKVDRIRQSIDEDNVEDGRLEDLREQLAKAEEEYEVHGGTYGIAVVSKQEKQKVLAVCKHKLDDVKLRIADHEQKINKVERKIAQRRRARELCLQSKNDAYETLKDLQEDMATAQVKVDRQAATVENFITEATRVCERVRVPPDETYRSLETKLQKLVELMNEAARRQGATDAQIQEAYEKSERDVDQAAKQIAELKELYQLLKKSYFNRVDIWQRFLKNISATARATFQYLLSERGFRGKLILDHSKKSLDLRVEPDETKRSANGRQTATLSGGEKSFSNICLLMSLWDAMGAPLRGLDEYDVFMDSINRSVSTRMLIETARKSVGKQFIVISPQGVENAMTNFSSVTDVKIHRYVCWLFSCGGVMLIGVYSLNKPGQQNIDVMLRAEASEA